MFRNISKKKVFFVSALLLSIVFLVSICIGFASAQTASPSPTPPTSTVTPSFNMYACPSSFSAVAGTTQTSTIKVYSVAKFAGTLDLSCSTSNGITCSLASASLTLKSNQAKTATATITIPSTTVAGKYQITVMAKSEVGTLTRSASIVVQVIKPDFNIQARPSCLSIASGTTENVIISANSLSRFNGTVALTASAPSGWQTPVLAKSFLKLTYNQADSTSLAISVPAQTASGKYAVVVTGISGSLSHSVTLTVEVLNPDFNIYASPSCLSLVAGTTGTSTIHVGPVNRFNGTVALATSGPSGWSTPALASSSVAITYATSATTTLSIAVPSDAAAGTYAVTVTSTSGSLSRTATVNIQVIRPTITLKSSPTQIAIPAGSTKSVTIGVVGGGRYNGTISLSVTAPSTWTTTLAKPTLTVKYNQCTDSTSLQITVPAGASAGKYSVTITGTSNPLSLTSSTAITVTVTGTGTYHPLKA